MQKPPAPPCGGAALPHFFYFFTHFCRPKKNFCAGAAPPAGGGGAFVLPYKRDRARAGEGAGGEENRRPGEGCGAVCDKIFTSIFLTKKYFAL